jgi:hypothetical protein
VYLLLKICHYKEECAPWHAHKRAHKRAHGGAVFCVQIINFQNGLLLIGKQLHAISWVTLIRSIIVISGLESLTILSIELSTSSAICTNPTCEVKAASFCQTSLAAFVGDRTTDLLPGLMEPEDVRYLIRVGLAFLSERIDWLVAALERWGVRNTVRYVSSAST